MVPCEGGGGDPCPAPLDPGRAGRSAISLVFGNSRTIVLAAANVMGAGAPLSLGGDEIAVAWETTVVSTLLPEIAADLLAIP